MYITATAMGTTYWHIGLIQFFTFRPLPGVGLLNEVVPAPAVPLAAAEYGEGDGAQRQQIGAYDEIPEIEEGASLRKGLEAGKRRKAQRGRK